MYKEKRCWFCRRIGEELKRMGADIDFVDVKQEWDDTYVCEICASILALMVSDYVASEKEEEEGEGKEEG